MIGVDTNVLVRLVVDEIDPAAVEQSQRARRFFAARTADDPVFVSEIVLVEFSWVLRRSYQRSAAEVARAIRGLLAADSVVVASAAVVVRALRDAEESGADFADALISHLGVASGCDGTVSFDRRAARLPGMLAV